MNQFNNEKAYAVFSSFKMKFYKGRHDSGTGTFNIREFDGRSNEVAAAHGWRAPDFVPKDQ